MKYYYLLLAGLAAVALASCNNDEEISGAAPNSGAVELRVSNTIEVQTRSYDPDGTPTQNTQIANGETVYVWVDESTDASAYINAWELTASGTSLAGSTQYFPDSGDNIDLYAIHGNFSETITEGETTFPSSLTHTVIADQSGMDSDASSYTSSDLLYAAKQGVAQTTDAVSLTFYHMLSKLELAIVKNTADVSITKVTLNDVVTDVTFTPAKASETSMATQTTRAAMLANGNTTGSMLISCETSTDFSSPTYNELILVPQDLTGKLLVFSLSDGTIVPYTFNQTFESGKKYQYWITIGSPGLSVTYNVEEWDSDGDPIESTVVTKLNTKTADEAEVGDYIMSDGSILDKESLTDDFISSVVAVVYYVGNQAYTDDAMLADTEYSHGLAVSLNSTESAAWGEEFRLMEWAADYYSYVSPTFPVNLSNTEIYNGYSNTQVMKAAAEKGYDFPILKELENLTNPANTSGWYIPSLQEFSTMLSEFNYDTSLEESLENVGRESISINEDYWTSTEYNESESYAITYLSPLLETYIIDNTTKSKLTACPTRPILAF